MLFPNRSDEGVQALANAFAPGLTEDEALEALLTDPTALNEVMPLDYEMKIPAFKQQRSTNSLYVCEHGAHFQTFDIVPVAHETVSK